MSLADDKKAERAERARRNGRKSLGPKSESGRERVKMNATKDGLRAKTYPLAGETDVAAEREGEWHAYYQPGSPAAIHLANEAARSSVVADRCERFRKARRKDQGRKTRKNFARRGRRQLDRVMKGGPADPLKAMKELATFSAGCARLAEDLANVMIDIRRDGYLPADLCWLTILHHGIDPVPESLAANVTAYTIWILNLGATPGVAPEECAARLDPAARPLALRGLAREELMPADPRVCAERLLTLIGQQRERYLAEAQRFRKEDDEPELERLLEESETLSEKDARKVKLSHSEARITFNRSVQLLYQILDRDRDENREGGNEQRGSGDSNGSADEAAAASRLHQEEAAVEGPLPTPAEGSPGPGDEILTNEPRIAPEARAQAAPPREEPAQVPAPARVVPQAVPQGATGAQKAPLAAPPRPVTPGPGFGFLHATPYRGPVPPVRTPGHSVGPRPAPGPGPGPLPQAPGAGA
jgi:hypothetical protein